MSVTRILVGTLLAMLLSAFVARNAFAQALPNPPAARQMYDSEIPPPPPQLILHTSNRPIHPARAPRILSEALVGVAGSVAYAIGAASVGAGELVILTPLLGSGLVQLVGQSMGSSGGYGWTLLGTVIGTAVALPIAVALLSNALQCIDAPMCDQTGADASVAGMVAVMILGPVVGAIIGHEVSSANAEAESDLHVMPTAGPTADTRGISIGVVGAF